MTDEEKIEAVTAALIGGVHYYDNPVTNRREIWRDGRLIQERHRAMCDGLMYATWGTYAERTPYTPT